MGSVRQVWLWFRSQELPFPLQSNTLSDPMGHPYIHRYPSCAHQSGLCRCLRLW
jgi:hypothetical protein